MKLPFRPSDQRGFTMIEVIVAMVLLLGGVLGTVTLLNTASASTQTNISRNTATNLVRQIIEVGRSLPYENIKPTTDPAGQPDNTVVGALQSSAPIAGGILADDDPATNGWQIRVRETTYTVAVVVCIADDAKDATIGDHSGNASYCPDLPTTPTGDSNGDDYRRMTATATWTRNGNTRNVKQAGLISNPSGGLGPAPIGTIGGPPGQSGTSCPAVPSADYPVKFDSSAVSVTFTVNDPAATREVITTFTTDVATGDRTFVLTWPKAGNVPPDNRYIITATAANSSGQERSVAVTKVINVCEPAAPTNFDGGFDWRRCITYPAPCIPATTRIFDMDWKANSEPDVLAYYVYAVVGAPDFVSGSADDTKVTCAGRGTATTSPGPNHFFEAFQPACWDEGLTAQGGLPVVLPPLTIAWPGVLAKYYVRAVDPDPADPTGATLRPDPTNHTDVIGTAGAGVTENLLNQRPSPPVLTVTDQAGVPCLTWTDSTDVDNLGDPAGSIRFYRVYRNTSVPALISDGSPTGQIFDVPYTDRVGRALPSEPLTCNSTNPLTPSWYSDKQAGSVSRFYWVTAVDQDYLESFPSNVGQWTAP